MSSEWRWSGARAFPGLALTPDEVAKFWPNKSDGNVMRIISGCIYSFFIDVNLFDNELFAVSYVDARRQVGGIVYLYAL